MQEAIDKAAALVDAYQYIRRFRGRVVVVKIGGSIMDDSPTLRQLLLDICFMHTVGICPVLVHGGGGGITEAMRQAGLEAQFVRGRRYTDERTLAIVEHVLVNQINANIVETIGELGGQAMGLHSLSSCAVFASRLFLDDEQDTSRKVDLGFVGDVETVNAPLIRCLLAAGTVPVIAPVARDASGGKLNVNADSVAGHVAASLGAEKLVLVSDTHGIRMSDDPDSYAPHLTRVQIEALVERSVITAGMLPKVEASLVALAGGVAKVHIVDGRIPHSLMLEVYTTNGIGTEIVL